MKKDCLILNGDKGIYTTDELVEILRKNKINFKLVTKSRSKKSHPPVSHIPTLRDSIKQKL